MDTKKTVAKYAKVYRKLLEKENRSDMDEKVSAYKKRLTEMYSSEKFKEHNIYPSTDVTLIYAIIAMCLELKGFGLEDQEIIDRINEGFSARAGFFSGIAKCVDVFPNTYRILEKWNRYDHDRRVKDGSVTFDSFEVTDGRIEYKISRCMYVEMFEAYGIRPLSKIFCMTDTRIYSLLTRHADFIRYSDLSDGDCCHDVVLEKRKH